MAKSGERMPSFQAAQSTLSPHIRGLLEDPVLIEDGISYWVYKALKPVDPLTLTKSDKTMAFYFRYSYSN